MFEFLGGARPISHERRSTERLCMLDTACVLAYACGIRLAGGGYLVIETCGSRVSITKYAAARPLSAIRGRCYVNIKSITNPIKKIAKMIANLIRYARQSASFLDCTSERTALYCS